VSGKLIHKAVEAFDGIIGWLTHFGYNYVKGMKSLDSVLDNAVNLAFTEIQHFFYSLFFVDVMLERIMLSIRLRL
jgi:AAA+ ATPase superfamily predicted ATPase